MGEYPQGMWIGADGHAREVRIKGGPLTEAFFGILRQREGELNATPGDLARAYASAVWAYRCIKLRADAVAGVPLVLRERDGTLISEHPLITLLTHPRPPLSSLSDLLRATEAAYNIWGVAYWLKVSNGGEWVRQVRWLNPQTVEAVSDAERGIIAYRQRVGTQTHDYAPQQVIAFRNFDPLDDLGGLSPLAVALSEVNADLNAARYVAAFFANDARPAGLLTTDQPLHESEIERTRTWWQRLFGGARNRWRTGIVGGGLKWQTITYPPTDLALAELRAEDRRAICAAFGVPPGLAGAWEATTFATAREQKASFYEDTILPQLQYLADVLNGALLPHYADLVARGARLAFDVDSIAALQESVGEKAQRLMALFQAGLVTRNEVRSALGLGAVAEDEDGFVEGLAPIAGPSPSSGVERVKGEVCPVAASPSLREELKRWERFAVKRVREGRPLRRFHSEVIPPDLQAFIEDALEEAESVTDVFALFGDVLAMLEQDGGEQGRNAAASPPCPLSTCGEGEARRS